MTTWTEAELELEALYGQAAVGLAFLDASLRVLRQSAGLRAHLAVTDDAPLAGPPDLVTAARRALDDDEPALALSFELLGGAAEVDLIPVRARGPGYLALVVLPPRVSGANVVNARSAALAELLARLTRRLLDMPRPQLLEQVRRELESLTGVLRLDYALVGQLGDEPGQLLRSVAAHSRHVSPLESVVDRLRASALPWASELVRAGRPVVAYHPAELPPEGIGTRRLMEDLGLASLLVLPLRVRGKSTGVLALARRVSDPSDAALTFWLQFLADTFAAALDRERIDLERENAAAQLEAARALLEDERDYLRREAGAAARPLVARSASMRAAVDLLAAVAGSDATVLLLGETGVGKELFASAIHEGSLRKQGPLVRVNCAAIPHALFESEFFGHAAGAFTGASRERKGRFELAHQGTLFLDEVGEIPLEAQAKLLRVLESGSFERVGDGAPRKADARVIAATNQPLEALVRQGRFREDLYYRLNVFPIQVPSLRDRREDLGELARLLFDDARRRFRRPPLALPDAELQRLLDYDWPGNVRELRNVMERAALLSTDLVRLELGSAGMATPRPRAANPEPRPASTPAVTLADVRQMERAAIEQAIASCNGRIAGEGGAAERLGIAPSTLRDRMRKLGIER